MFQPRPYQYDGASFLASKTHALLGDAPRVGKTAQAIMACERVGADYVMVLCPASAVEHWRREFNRIMECPPALSVMSYGTAARLFADNLPTTRIDVLILDEAHYLKNFKAARTKMVFGKKCKSGGLVSCAKRVYLLTGTPMPKDPSELWPALRALYPEAITSGRTLKPYDFHQFVTKYCKTINNGFGLKIVGAKNHSDLADKLKPFMLRRTLEQVAPSMPKLDFSVLPISAQFPRGVPGSEIEQARKALAAGGLERLAEQAGNLHTLRRLTGMAKVAPVIEWAKTHFECGGGKLVIFAHHHEVIDALAYGLAESQLDWVRITGDTSPPKRQRVIDDFQNGLARVFLGQLQAAGTSVRLDAADEVLFVEWSWVPNDNYQPACRVLDVTKTRPCLARFVTIPNSIDEGITRVSVRRMADIAKILGGV